MFAEHIAEGIDQGGEKETEEKGVHKEKSKQKMNFSAVACIIVACPSPLYPLISS